MLCAAVAFFIGLEGFEMLKNPENSRFMCVIFSVGGFFVSFWLLWLAFDPMP